VPCLMIVFEIMFISDMIGITNLLIPYLNGAGPSSSTDKFLDPSSFVKET